MPLERSRKARTRLSEFFGYMGFVCCLVSLPLYGQETGLFPA